MFTFSRKNRTWRGDPCRFGGRLMPQQLWREASVDEISKRYPGRLEPEQSQSGYRQVTLGSGCEQTQ